MLDTKLLDNQLSKILWSAAPAHLFLSKILVPERFAAVDVAWGIAGWGNPGSRVLKAQHEPR